MKSDNNICVGAGLISLDVLIWDGQRVPISYYVGGTCGNVMMILAHMGWEAFPIARLDGTKDGVRVLADVMAQLDYMEKRGSGLKRICNETKALEAYKDDRRPVFKSSPSQFMTIIYSVDYNDAGQVAGQDTNNVTKQSLSWDQVGTKLGLSRDQVEKLLLSAIQATSAAEIRHVMNMTNATKFKRNYIDPLLELRILAMTQPDSPKSPTQKYYLTELGKQLIKK